MSKYMYLLKKCLFIIVEHLGLSLSIIHCQLAGFILFIDSVCLHQGQDVDLKERSLNTDCDCFDYCGFNIERLIFMNLVEGGLRIV
jgi:hypothetical protein